MNDHFQLKAIFDFTWTNFVVSQYSEVNPIFPAIKYCLTGDGKRARAILTMLVTENCGKQFRSALSSACAIELIHAYSLVHDDLPCMDNDDWRRGRPSLHKAFDDATALLAGDGLLTDAFRVLTDSRFFPDNFFVSPTDQSRQVAYLAKAAGSHGMVLGQSLDLFWTNRIAGFNEDVLKQIHLNKTGALLGACCALGAIAAGISDQEVLLFETFGKNIGVAFQAIDDALDESSFTGKSAGKDLEQGKLTFRSFYSKEEIIAMSEQITQIALKSLPVKPSIELTRFAEALIFRQK
jgi:geranylgeranyl diphosphate synthase, type II